MRFRRPRLRALVLTPVALAALAGAATTAERPPRTPAGVAADRPNVLVVMTDDQTVQSLLAARGTTFENAIVTFALCCPSRATYLTGQYAHNHGVRSNSAPDGGYYRLDGRETLPVWLQRVGYHTAHIGKYLNGYGTRNPREVPPGWSEWYGSVDPSTYRYWNYTLNENGRLVTYGTARGPQDPAKYQTDVYAQKAADLLRREAARPGPFYLDLAFLAPHSGGPRTPGDPRTVATPELAPRHKGRFAAEPLPAPPSFNEADVSDKPAAIRRRPAMGPSLIAQVTSNYRQRLESLLAVDEAVGTLVRTLEQTGEIDRTTIVFTSDNGFLHGEHRVPQGKVLPYEPSIRVPLIVRGPGVPQGLRLRQNVANIDIAPTLVDFTGATPGRTLDGRSLLPLMADPGIRLGRDLLVEGPPGAAGFSSLRTNRFLYTEYATGERELYDLTADPDELQSRHADPAAQGFAASLAQRLAALRLCAGASCRQPPRVGLALRTIGSGRCRATRLQARPVGPDAGKAARIATYVDGRRVRRDARASIPRAWLAGGKASVIRLRVVLGDGRAVTLDRRVRGCPRS
jgi:N-acetylglucosamine-6-sulfatase